MERRNLIGLLAGTVSGCVLLNKANANNEIQTEPENDDDISNTYSKCIVFASRTGAKLDSNVISGGGIDDTTILQTILDKAPEMGSLHLVMDGAALVRGLLVHPNTTIECLNSSCGFFLASQSNCSVIRNANPKMSGERIDKNITLIGGTYNHNCKEQEHHVIENGKEKWVMGMEFYGVENFTMRDVTIRNQRTFALLMANWFRVNMENVSIDLPDHMNGQNQDGLHFYGPGQFLTLRNIQGSSGDDFIAIAPDEYDLVSDITDVLIDGVFLNNVDQGIRLLSRDKGRLDRVIIKNVTGTYKSFGFYIDPWFKGSSGNFGNIVFDSVNLNQLEPNYTYTTPFLFRLGGKIESLVLKNIYHHNPSDNRSVVDIGWPTPDGYHDSTNTHVSSLIIDGLHIQDTHEQTADAAFIKILAKVDNLIVRNTEILKSDKGLPNGCLVETRDEAKIGTLIMNNIYAQGVNSLLHHGGSEIKAVQLNSITCSNAGEFLLQHDRGEIQKIHSGEINGTKLISKRKSN